MNRWGFQIKASKKEFSFFIGINWIYLAVAAGAAYCFWR